MQIICPNDWQELEGNQKWVIGKFDQFKTSLCWKKRARNGIIWMCRWTINKFRSILCLLFIYLLTYSVEMINIYSYFRNNYKEYISYSPNTTMLLDTHTQWSQQSLQHNIHLTSVECLDVVVVLLWRHYWAFKMNRVFWWRWMYLTCPHMEWSQEWENLTFWNVQSDESCICQSLLREGYATPLWHCSDHVSL